MWTRAEFVEDVKTHFRVDLDEPNIFLKIIQGSGKGLCWIVCPCICLIEQQRKDDMKFITKYGTSSNYSSNRPYNNAHIKHIIHPGLYSRDGRPY